MQRSRQIPEQAMSELDDYLKQHYLNAEQFASLCGTSVDKLNNLIEGKRVPAPSYVVTPDSIVRSAVFGEMPTPGSIPGAYFHPKNCVWVQQAIVMEGAQALKENFTLGFASALAALNKNTWQLSDSFADNGDPIPDGLEARTEAAWQHFLNGTFGLCVADPSSARSIARKEVLQEKLT
ncbi:MAG TPA: DUF6058 family natural product biosynthesis protein, partial [Gammaproteobacteria bacterium]|nr:DUF6058 family natural product biosynthesis protein [Gammaproteobacteria bacterium]